MLKITCCIPYSEDISTLFLILGNKNTERSMGLLMVKSVTPVSFPTVSRHPLSASARLITLQRDLDTYSYRHFDYVHAASSTGSASSPRLSKSHSSAQFNYYVLLSFFFNPSNST